MSYDDMLIWLTQQDINQMNDGLKVIKIKKIIAESDKDYDKNKIDKGHARSMADPNGLELIPRLQCFNCMNYGHGARDCNAPYCNQCEIIRPGHQSNACPNPKKKTGRRRVKAGSTPIKRKEVSKLNSKPKGKKSLKLITTSSYQTDEDEEKSLRHDAESEWENNNSEEGSEEETNMPDHKRSRRMR
ncbi:MAG: hypothetical protein EB127_20085, partial [Alphaproteobacteria bacterium]|nr:hypothetical protein [Alphaproteobacteria bacterium]